MFLDGARPGIYSKPMNRFFGGGNDAEEDKAGDPGFIEAELRDGIEKELRRTDISDEDRKSYEAALAKLDGGDAKEAGDTSG